MGRSSNGASYERDPVWRAWVYEHDTMRPEGRWTGSDVRTRLQFAVRLLERTTRREGPVGFRATALMPLRDAPTPSITDVLAILGRHGSPDERAQALARMRRLATPYAVDRAIETLGWMGRYLVRVQGWANAVGREGATGAELETCKLQVRCWAWGFRLTEACEDRGLSYHTAQQHVRRSLGRIATGLMLDEIEYLPCQ